MTADPVWAPPQPEHARPRYLPGLDGLRAVAVVAVLLYHAELSWIPGGFLGVDVFFVISGYLITLLLLEEQARRGTISVKGFYRRRARRLLPALYLLLLTVCIVAALFYREELATLRGQVVSALTYSTNWYLIFIGGSYFEQLGRPLVLRHLWSLAVEEQFYLAWPIVMLVMLRRARGRIAPLALTIGVAAAASTVLMAVLYDAGRDPSRVYYGTDTRVSTLLIGALLAVFWRPSALSHGHVRVHRALFDVIGLVALALIVVSFLNVHETSRRLYEGGFLGVALVSALAVAAATHPAAAFGRVLLGNRPLRWIGVRSYALYLWHWPIFVMTRPHVDTPLAAGPVLALRLGLTVLLADLSYRLVESPIRRMGFRRWLRRALRIGPGGARRPVGGAVVLAVLAGIGVLTAAIVSARAPVSEIEQSLRAGQQAIAASARATPSSAAPRPSVPTLTAAVPTTAVEPTAASTTPVSVEPSVAPTVASAPPESVATTVAPTTIAPATAPPTVPAAGPVIAMGDSVMLGAAPQPSPRSVPTRWSTPRSVAPCGRSSASSAPCRSKAAWVIEW